MIKINEKREVVIYSINGTMNENNTIELIFDIPQKYKEWNKRIVFITPDGNKWDYIDNNLVYLVKNNISKYNKIEAYLWLTTTINNVEKDFRSKTFEISFNKNELADDVVPTEEELDGFNTLINELNLKIEEVKSLDSVSVEIIEQAQQSANEAKLSSNKAQQVLSDLLNMLGTDIATLENGKIPANQIPAIATTEIYYASNLKEMNNLVVQNGDICIRTDEKKSYIYKDTGWVFLLSPSDFATNAEHSNTADFASNAGMINDKRIISMTQEQYDLAVKEENTYYFVTAD